MFQEFAVPNCIEGATYDPWKSLGETTTSHNYREGNLPPNSKFVHIMMMIIIINVHLMTLIERRTAHN